MAFHTTYPMMLKHDIKHIYFGEPVNLQYRDTDDHPTLEQLQRIRADRVLKTNVLKSKTAAYRTGTIPAAPAFRVVSRFELEEILARLTRSTTASRGVGCTADQVMRDKMIKEHHRYLGLKKPSTLEQDSMTQRLTQTTHASQLKGERNPYRIISANQKIHSSAAGKQMSSGHA